MSDGVVERWRNVPGYRNYYQVSDLGRVRSLERGVYQPRAGSFLCLRGRTLNTTREFKGYLHVRLSMDGKARTWLVHTLVTLAFIGPRPEGLEIDHLNSDPSDNRLVNLEYVSSRENTRRSIERGRWPAARPPRVSGEAHGGSRLTAHQVEDIRSLRGSVSGRRVAESYGVNHQTIYNIWNGQTWRVK